jgi:type VI secretion system secreted protein VgrG
LDSNGAGEVDAKGKGIKSVIDAAVKAFFTGKPNA